MSKFTIKTTEGTAVICGDRMVEKGDLLYVYLGEELYGIFRVDYIVDAHRT